MPSFAATRIVNPPGASPTLTRDQVWKGLLRKIREPQEFVKAISSCRIEVDEPGKIVRQVRFGEGPEVKEEVTFFEPTIAYFEMTPPSSPSAPSPPPVRITNLISYGPPPSHDLLLTFTFTSLPHVSAVKAEQMSSEELNEVVGKGVEEAVEVVRGLVREGKL